MPLIFLCSTTVGGQAHIVLNSQLRKAFRRGGKVGKHVDRTSVSSTGPVQYSIWRVAERNTSTSCLLRRDRLLVKLAHRTASYSCTSRLSILQRGRQETTLLYTILSSPLLSSSPPPLLLSSSPPPLLLSPLLRLFYPCFFFFFYYFSVIIITTPTAGASSPPPMAHQNPPPVRRFRHLSLHMSYISHHTTY